MVYPRVRVYTGTHWCIRVRSALYVFVTVFTHMYNRVLVCNNIFVCVRLLRVFDRVYARVRLSTRACGSVCVHMALYAYVTRFIRVNACVLVRAGV